MDWTGDQGDAGHAAPWLEAKVGGGGFVESPRVHSIAKDSLRTAADEECCVSGENGWRGA